jgi:glycosyltransferase involved in cell wall biosynthesis
MKKLLIEGWRGINHSYAMVNQHQILALANLGGFEIYHHDMPFWLARWNANEHSAGFEEKDAQFIASLADLPEGHADAIYRIGAPIHAPRSGNAITITYVVTELGLKPSLFADPGVPPSAYTNGGNLVVTPSRWARDRLLDYGFAEQSVRVVGHGVDTQAFNPLSPHERALFRSNLGLDPDETVFLNVGAPIWNKGNDLLIEAFARMHQRYPRTRLILKDAQQLYGLSIKETVREVGAKHPALITEALLAAISVIPGNMSQELLRQLYGVSDCYVSAYRAEGFNLPVLEALACGKSVIVSSCGATDDFCNGAAVRRIPSTFCRGALGDHAGACWVEPHLPSLVDLMAEAAAQGPGRLDLQAAAVEQAERHSWPLAAIALATLAGLTSRTQQLQVPARAREIHLYCDGGFGNRFNTLVSGLLLAKAAGLKPIVVWPRNNWCGASFAELLANDFEVIERELIDYAPDKERFHFFMTEDHLGLGVSNRSPLQAQTLAEAVDFLNADRRDVYYHSPLIPPFLNPDEVVQQVRELKINAEIEAQADRFVSDQGLDEFFGVQIRKTDFGSNGADDSNLFELIRNAAHKKFFVCSDDKDVEQRFGALPNVAIYAKRAHVEKLIVDGGWNSVTSDHSGRAYACNVNRSAISVVDAVVDLLILSRSEVVKTSNSTFLQTALLLKAGNSIKSADEIHP